MEWAAIKLFLGGVPKWVWQLLGLLALIAGIFFAGAHWQGKRDQVELDAEKAASAKFRAETKALGDEAAKQAKLKEAADKAKKEQADAKYKETVVYLSDELDRLRSANPSGRTVPAAPTGSRNSALACFDRAELNQAVDGLLADLQGQARQGAEAAAGLNVIRAWANNKSAP